MSFPNEFGRHERSTDAPISLDLTAGDAVAPPTGLERLAPRMGVPRSWVGMTAYLTAGVLLGLVLIVAVSLGRGSDAAAAASPNAVVDNIVHLHARDIGSSCWQGVDRSRPARLRVALEVGIDGKIRYAAASGESSAMRGCVEAHVKSWEFLPQSQAQTMALPFEVDGHH